MTGLFGPITFNMDVNPFVYAYNTGNVNTFGYPYPNGMLFNNSSPYASGFFYNIFAPANYNSAFGCNYTPMNIFAFGGGYTQTPAPITTPAPTTVTNPQNTKPTTPAASPTPTPTQTKQVPANMGQLIVQDAKKYSNVSEATNGHLQFIKNKECHDMDPHNEEWCTDYVTYVVKETYEKQGCSVPAGFGSHDVATLKRWAQSKNKFIDTRYKQNKQSFIANNIKPGDIIILNEKKCSHTGFVTAVNADGSFETIEGNVGDPGGVGNGRVETGHYEATDERLSGFIRLS